MGRVLKNTLVDKEIDEIVFRCIDQGVYWGKLAYSENERPDKPEKPIDRTEAFKLLQSLINAHTKKLLTEVLDKLPKKEKLVKGGEISIGTNQYNDYTNGHNHAIQEIKELIQDTIKKVGSR